MPQLPPEMLMEITEHLNPFDDLPDLLNLRLVSRATSRAAINIMFRCIDIEISQDVDHGLPALLGTALDFPMAVQDIALNVHQSNANQPEFTFDFVRHNMGMIQSALERLARVDQIRIIIDSDVVEAKMTPGDETANVTAMVISSILNANRGLNKRVIIEARDDINFHHDHVWGDDNASFQRFIAELTHYELDTSGLNDDVRHLVNLADHLSLATDKLQHFKIERNGEAWHVFQPRMIAPALQYELCSLVSVDLCNTLCTAPDLRGFLDKSAWCLESLSLSAVLLIGFTRSLEGVFKPDYSSGPPLPRIVAPVMASTWRSVFQHLLDEYPKLKHFDYQWLCTQTRFENDWWPADGNPDTRILPGEAVERYFKLGTASPIHRKRIPEPWDRRDELALGRLLLACMQRSGAPRSKFTRPEQNMMKSAEYEDMERRIVPTRAAKTEALNKMAGME